MSSLLRGLVVGLQPDDAAHANDANDADDAGIEFGETAWARWFLGGLGAVVVPLEDGEDGARVVGSGAPALGLPPGVLALAGGYVLAAAALAAKRAGRNIVVDRYDIARQLALPAVVAAATNTAAAAKPPEPLRWGEGALCADLGAGHDAEDFERLSEVVGTPRPNAETMAERAQEWRLAVTPYRRHRRQQPQHPLRHINNDIADRGAATRQRPGPIKVLDLTIMWSGPLCTALLAQLGMEVVKIEPTCRPDGLRDAGAGHLYRILNAAKTHLALDLREPQEHRAFLDLVAEADVVIDNFSPRVAANLGIEPTTLAARNPGLVTLSMPAFPPGPMRHWVAYGTGVHGALGLGDYGHDAWRVPPVTYADPLAGFAALASVLALLAARDLGRNDGLAGEVALAAAAQPLLSLERQPWSVEAAVTDAAVAQMAAGWAPEPPLSLLRYTDPGERG